MEEGELRQMAEALRAELPSLVEDAAERTAIDSELAQALEQPPGSGQEAIRAAIDSRAATREWLRRRPQTGSTGRLIGPLGQPTTSALGVLFVCPNGDYSFVREALAEEVPLCPYDGSVLQRQGR